MGQKMEKMSRIIKNWCYFVNSDKRCTESTKKSKQEGCRCGAKHAEAMEKTKRNAATSARAC